MAIYVALGGLRSAIFNEVLQFVLIWLGALLIPILGLIEAGGWSEPEGAHRARNWPDQDYTHLWTHAGLVSATIPMGIHWTGIVFGLGFVISLRLLDHGFSGGAARARRPRTCARRKMAPIIGAAFKMMVPFIVILPGLLALAVLPFHLVGRDAGRGHRAAQLQRSAAADAGALLRTGAAGAGHHGADRRLHVAAWRAT